MTSRQSKRSSRAGPVAPAKPLGVLRENTNCLEARTADDSAAFFLSYLTPGMSLLDCGCGPGTITVDIAKAAALGRVVGIDMHEPRLAQARALAAERSADNVSFQVASVYELPFEDNTFDAAFENSMLEHVNDPVIAAREIHRVLKPGGVFGARDVDNEGRLWGSLPPELNGLPEFLFALRSRQGSNLRIGKQLRGILRHAGFKNVVGSASVESHGTTEAMMRFAERMVRVLEAPETRQTAFDHQLVDETTLKQWSVALRDWGAHPDSFHAFIRCEAVGWKK